MITTHQQTNFLKWLQNRLRIKYNDKDPYIESNINEIIALLEKKPLIDINKVMKICHQLYPTFSIKKDEKSMFDIGYSNKEKTQIIKHVTDIINAYNTIN